MHIFYYCLGDYLIVYSHLMTLVFAVNKRSLVKGVGKNEEENMSEFLILDMILT